MARIPLWSQFSETVRTSHGKKGYVRLGADILPETKDRLIVQAEQNNVPLVSVVRDAFDFYLDAVEAQ